VLVVGAGGLGCAVLQYLCAAGIGKLVIIDHDRVEESNLHRQPLYRMSDLGAPKVHAARAALAQLNPEIQIETIEQRLTPANVSQLVAKTDLIVDAADILAVTYILSDECYRAGKALISASVLGLSGYVGTFCGGAPSYRAVFPEMPRQTGSCATSGVIGTAVGVMGTLQAHMTLALALQLQPSPLGQLVSVDFRTMKFGGFSFMNAPEPTTTRLSFIAPADVSSEDVVVDLRSVTEAPFSPFASARRISVNEIERHVSELPRTQRIVLCCRTGVRAWRAARLLESRGHTDIALIALGE
jgi:molybdopterin/thiamine biosynthesis adenylyltransferase/rhodanese-related sulfurtransferase